MEKEKQEKYEKSIYEINVKFYKRQLQILQSLLHEIEAHEITSKETAIGCIKDANCEYYAMTRNVYSKPFADEATIQAECLKKGREILDQIASITIEKLQF